MSVEKENELARKIGKLERFMDTQDRRPSLADDQHLSAPVATATEKKENVEYNKFLEEWKHLDGYTFPEDTQNFGFVKGTKLFIETGETALPPDTT